MPSRGAGVSGWRLTEGGQTGLNGFDNTYRVGWGDGLFARSIRYNTFPVRHF